ncbi:Transposase, Mutator family [Pelosinus propionicus DSM 13327]|uniref:Mutator family transposase n=1 Tax=Pelosinus propionicus DSM 13327 TaxID=1123291 RepID=A0A1I4M3P6_9FIRM|nr:Transposase, Mutator family [Pelosinus propionicus DSM 13327]
MEAELDAELGYEKQERQSEDVNLPVSKNYRNGYSKKAVKTQLDEAEIAVPHDRNGEFEPKIIDKYSRNTDGMEEKILFLYATGLSIRDISDQIKSLYDVEISP